MTLTFAINTKKHKNNKINIKTAKTILKKSEEEKKINNIKNKIKKEENNNNDEKNKKKKKFNIEAQIAKFKNMFLNIGNYFKKLFRDLLNFIISPAFIIQFARVMSIAWMYFYRNFYSLGIFVTVFFSFLFINTTRNKYLTIFLLTPMVFISLKTMTNLKGLNICILV